MAEFLFKIEDTFQLENVGLVVAVDIKEKDAKVKMGDEIELRLPNSLPILTKVAGIPISSPYNPERTFSFSLPKDINKADVSIGTEVWSHPFLDTFLDSLFTSQIREFLIKRKTQL